MSEKSYADLINLNSKLEKELEKLKKKLQENAEDKKQFKKICLQFDHIFENTIAGLMILSPDGKIIKCNDACNHLFQAGEKDLTGTSFWNLIDHESKKDIENWFELKSKIEQQGFEILFKLKNETTLWSHVTLSSIKDENTDTNYIFCQIHNISELKKVEEMYTDQYNLLYTLINAVPDNVFAKDTKSRFILANKWVAEIMGCTSPEQLFGKTDFDFYPEKLASKYYEDEQEIIVSGNPKINIIERVLVGEKDLRWYSTTKVPLRNTEDEIIGIMGIGRDITQSVREKKALKRAKKIAEKADQLKSAFLANMSHEIRTPLNGIIGFSQFLKQAPLEDEKKDKYLDIILFNGKQLLHLINDIIDISKIDSGQITIAEKAFSLNHLLLQLKQTFLGELSHKNKDHIALKVTLGLNDEDSIIKTDDFRLKQILINLIGNAVKFTSEGSIEYGYHLLKNNKLKFFIKDTGIGIAKDKINIIFERFRQADGSLTRRYGGTGLGLSISKGLIDLLGGEINVESKTQAGTKFTFTLPYTKADSVEEPIKRRKKNFEEILSNKTVLVVEDDKDSFKYLESILKLYKMNIIYTTGGQKAIEIVENESPHIDLILMDIRLQGMNGYEATRSIKKINKNIPVIAQTAYAFEDDKEKCMNAGCDDYLTKPIDADLLTEKIYKLIKNRTNQ